MTTPSIDYGKILNLPLGAEAAHDSGATTIGGYLVALLAALWDEGECFSPKRPFGNSGWERDLATPLEAAGYVSIVDDDGTFDWYATRDLVTGAIWYMIAGLPKPGTGDPRRATLEPNGRVSVPAGRYLRLYEMAQTLSALEAHGVDNWEWYGEDGMFDGIDDRITIEARRLGIEPPDQD